MLGYKISLLFYRRILIWKLKKLKRKNTTWHGDICYNQAIDDCIKEILYYGD